MCIIRHFVPAAWLVVIGVFVDLLFNNGSKRQLWAKGGHVSVLDLYRNDRTNRAEKPIGRILFYKPFTLSLSWLITCS